ncbi:MAG: hypothetical protein KAG14_02760 [Mycoplasmataceae bacterium]|nr:hypothetical protein [Mycoplasmataceae bacterium]
MSKIIDWTNSWTFGGKLSIIFFIIFVAFTVFFALKIVKNAEVLSAKSKFGGGIIGGILIAIVTAAPEFITSIQQSLSGEPGAGSADNIGANAITGFMIGLAGLLFIRESFLGKMQKWTIITLWISFVVSLIITLVMYFKADVIIGVKGTYAIGIFPAILLIIYFVLLFLQSKFGDNDDHAISGEYTKKTSLKKASWLFVMWGILLIIGSIIINIFADSMKKGLNLSNDSVGGIFLSIAMALPEAVAFFILLKHKQFSAAVAVLIGHGFALFVSEWLVDVAYADNASYLTEEVHNVWPISVITTISFGLLGIIPLLYKKYPIFRENKFVYAILPSMVVATYVIGWILILTLQ